MLLVFFILCFLCLAQCLLSFFTVLFGKNFRERTFVLECRGWSCVFDSVLPRLFLYYLVFRPRKCLGKILLMSGPLFEKFSGANFGFGCRCWSCVFCAVLPMFLLYYLVFRSRKCLGKIS